MAFMHKYFMAMKYRWICQFCLFF